MKFFYVFLAVMCVSFAEAQLTVQSSSPANNSVNVPLTTSISVTFSAALDTTYPLGADYGVFWNFESASAAYYSPDHRTVTFDVTLSPATVYVVCVYYARAQGGGTLQSPYPLLFTTAASFPPYTVSGNVLSGTTGVSPASALVILSLAPISSSPQAVTGAVADVNGAFVMPHVANGLYYPIAAKDANGDGRIDPSSGDVLAAGDPVTVNNANVSGVNLTFFAPGGITLSEAIPIADSVSATLPPDKTLRNLSGYEVDSVGGANDWEFNYLRNSQAAGYRVRVGSFERKVDPLDSMMCQWLVPARPLTNPGSAAGSAVFLANVENAGGREFRHQTPGGNLTFLGLVNLGDLRWTDFWSLIPDTSQNYWGAEYSFGYDSTNQWVSVLRMKFLGDYATGTILVVADVKPGNGGLLPGAVALSQNYPNPFNPTTQIHFSLPREEWTTLTVYNLIGQEVATLVRGLVPAGGYTVRFDAANLASGIYIYRLAAGTQVVTKRMVIIK